ncbi:GntR family transcriptional regulator [Candidatus Fermentibacteria bacterium]|nr:GntR family transcriptional regulator [Candidatus Fermentibacteria bacterium]
MPGASKERIYLSLFSRIFDGEYGENTRLKEEELAREFGVSRTPIREVLRQLEQDGVVQLVPHRGASVNPFTADDVEELYEIRKKLEVLALEFAVPGIKLQTLRELKAMIEAITDSCSPERVAEIDRSLHNYIISSSGKPRLSNLLGQVMRLMERFQYIGSTHTSASDQRLACQDHLELIEAMMRRDRETATAVLANHIERSKQLAVSFLFIHQKR